jgi:hypothetical protein
MRFLFLLLMPCVALADTSSLNLALPTSPQSFQTDRFRAGDMDCSSAIGSATNIEFGVVGVINEGNQFAQQLLGQGPIYNDAKDIGVYGKITIPIGGPKERINCNVLYELELERRRLEIAKLKQEVEALRSLKFEN